MTSSPLASQLLLLSSSGSPDLLAVDAASGSSYTTFKTSAASRLGVTLLPRTQRLAAAQANKLAINILSWTSDSPEFKCHTAEKLNALVVTSCGNYLFAGGLASGKIYLWDVKTGELVTVFDAHYKRINDLKLTDDDSHLISCGDDAVIHVWRLVDLLDSVDSTDLSGLTPLVSWTEHVLPVTQVHVGMGGVNARIYSCSLDRTIKVWSLASPQSLVSISLPSFINALICDGMESRLYAACGDSKIYSLDLSAAAAKLSQVNARIVSSASNDELVSDKNAFEGHEDGVSLLQISACGRYLVSADDRAVIKVWETASKQCLRSLTPFQGSKGKIESMVLTSKPSGEDESLPVAPLKKYMNSS